MKEPMTKELTLTRVFDAPRELVFRAWTDPELLAQWWGPNGVTNPVSEVEARVGGAMHIVMLAGAELGPLAGQRWPMQGVIQEIVEPEKFVFTNQAVDEDGNVLIDGITTVLLEEVENGKTKLTLSVTAKAVSEQAPQMLEGMQVGWAQSIDKLTEYVTSHKM
ncbi:MAG TPA: SRPBCC domain-containing protein [Candidatus Saccharimonadia bacterium]|nr:SRPBCC domain-containing protein [Candidatus Saccharimonadia bacterium]